MRGPQPDLWRPAAAVVLAMAVLGAALGPLWKVWSPPGPAGFVIAAHAIQPDETEAMVAADGRFAVLAALTGMVAALAVWQIKSLRGPIAVLALAAGGLGGAALTEAVGRLVDGGSTTGSPGTVIRHLPLAVHMSGLRVVEAAVAVLGYGLLASFAAADDLGGPVAAVPEDAEAAISTTAAP
jgi:hypothetical protein